jgi:uncharacterized protein YqgC (DUF456 family)
VLDPVVGGWVLAVALAGIGLVGIALPVVPGAPLLFAGLALGAWLDDFRYVSEATVAGLAVMAIATYGIDFVAGSLGAKKFGASPRAVFGAACGAVAGLFFGLPGVILGPFVGAVLGELSAQRSLGEAGRAGLGATLGLALGAAAKLALGLSMVGIFVFARLV